MSNIKWLTPFPFTINRLSSPSLCQLHSIGDALALAEKYKPGHTI